MDGSIIIGTELDTDKLEQQLKNSEKELMKYEKEAEELLNQRNEIDIDTQKAQLELDEVDKKITDIKSKMLEMEKNPWKIEGASYQLLGKDLSIEEEKRKNILNQIENKYIDIDEKINNNIKKQQEVRENIVKINQELKNTNVIDNISKKIESVGKSLKNTVKQTIHWGLAIFGIRSAYMFVSQAMSTLSQYDEQMAINIQYIRYLLASTLKPVIEYLIQLAYKLLAYINYIAMAWFKINLFANASTEAFQKQNKAMSGTANKAKELKKTLTGFDEMNILQENGNVSSGGGGGGIEANLPDFAKMEDVKIPQWLIWIKDNWKIVAVGLGIILGTLLMLKLGITGLNAVLGGVILTQIVLILIGIIKQIENIIRFIKDPSWDNFFKLIEGFFGTQGIIGVLIDQTVEKFFGGWNNIKSKLEEVNSWIDNNVIKPLLEKFQKMYDKIKKIFEPLINFFKSLFETVFNNIKTMWNNVIVIVKFVKDEIIKIFNPIAKWFKDKFKEVYDGITERLKPLTNFISNLWEEIKKILKKFGTTIGEAVSGAFKSVINQTLNVIENTLNKPIKAINGLISSIGKVVPGLSKLNTFKFPRLAKGGIINMPGRGVPVGSAIAGERGMEGVIPLTDSQQMALLGEAIGKYITINANIVNTMNGRVISRELQTIKNESDFAYNR